MKKIRKTSRKHKGKKATSPTQVRIRERREKVIELSLKGLTQDRIAKLMKLTRRTIQDDLNVVRQENIEWVKQMKKEFDPKDFWSKRLKELQLRKREMYVALAESKGDRTLVIKSLKEIDDEFEKALAKVGIRTEAQDAEDVPSDVLRIIHEYRK